MNKMNKYVVSYVEYGDTCDGNARKLGVFNSFEEALNEAKLDMKEFAGNYDDAEIDMGDMTVMRDGEIVCKWYIVET